MTGGGGRTTRTVSKVFIRGRIEHVWREITKRDEPQAWVRPPEAAPVGELAVTGDGPRRRILDALLHMS